MVATVAEGHASVGRAVQAERRFHEQSSTAGSPRARSRHSSTSGHVRNWPATERSGAEDGAQSITLLAMIVAVLGRGGRPLGGDDDSHSRRDDGLRVRTGMMGGSGYVADMMGGPYGAAGE